MKEFQRNYLRAFGPGRTAGTEITVLAKSSVIFYGQSSQKEWAVWGRGRH